MVQYYSTIHRYETNRLRNIARLFGHLLSSDAIGWHVLSIIHLNEDETTSSSRIFIKILFQDLAEALGMPKLQARFKDDMLRSSFEGIFPVDEPRKTRFSINYFTSIGMGGLTEEMREHLQNAPKPAPIMPLARAPSESRSRSSSVSSYSSYSSYSGSSRSDSRSRSPSRSRRPRSRSVTPPPPRRNGYRRRSYSSSVSRSPSPPPRRKGTRRRSFSSSVSRSPPRRRRPISSSPSPSPPPRRRERRRSYSRSPSPPPRRGR